MGSAERVPNEPEHQTGISPAPDKAAGAHAAPHSRIANPPFTAAPLRLILVPMRRLLFLLVLCLQTRPLVAEPSGADHAFLERLRGSWILRGTLAGKITTHDVTAAWILDGLYLELHERSRETDAKGKPQYEAVILLGVDPATGEYQCLWLDSTGGGGLAPAAFGRGNLTTSARMAHTPSSAGSASPAARTSLPPR